MKQTEIPLEVQQFVAASIPTIPHLEALMLLRATAPAHWGPDSLARRLYISRQAAAQVLADLSKDGILGCAGVGTAFFYPARAGAPTALVDRLSALYATRLVEITRLVHSSDHRRRALRAPACATRSTTPAH
jgi:DNA-binding MarR family transcriptional regulator